MRLLLQRGWWIRTGVAGEAVPLGSTGGTRPGELWCRCTQQRDGEALLQRGGPQGHASMQFIAPNKGWELLLLKPCVSWGGWSWQLGGGGGNSALPSGPSDPHPPTAQLVEPRPGAGHGSRRVPGLGLSVCIRVGSGTWVTSTLSRWLESLPSPPSWARGIAVADGQPVLGGLWRRVPERWLSH